jgi:hypothetical protein
VADPLESLVIILMSNDAEICLRLCSGVQDWQMLSNLKNMSTCIAATRIPRGWYTGSISGLLEDVVARNLCRWV